MRYLALVCLLISSVAFARRRPADEPKKIDPKYYEPGCTVDNAPAHMLHDRQLTIADGKDEYVPCDNSNMGYRIRKSMQKLGRMLGMNGTNRWAKSVVGSNPYKFVLDRMDLLEIVDVENANCDVMTNGYFQKFDGNFKSVKICPSAKFGSDLNLMALMLHEARHADDKKHVNCEFGPMSVIPDRYACDPSIEDTGAYGVTTEFYLAAMKESSLTPEERQSARSSAVYYLMSRFNKLPAGLDFSAVLYPEAGGVYMWDGKRETKILAQVPPGFMVATRPSNPILFRKSDGAIMSYDGQPERWKTKPDDVLSQDRIKSVRNELVDQGEFGDMNCYLFARKLACWKISGDKNTVWNFKTREAARLLIIDRRMEDPKAKPGSDAYLVETNGETTILPTAYADLEKTGPFEKKDSAMKEYAATIRDTVTFPLDSKFPYMNLALAHRSPWLVIQDRNKKTGSLKDLKTLPLRRIMGPTVWSEVLENL